MPQWVKKAPAEIRQIVDDQGNTLVLDAPVRRIIALYGAYNEILAEMGLSERLVARTKADVLPPCIMQMPCIGTHMRPNVEMILALKPDLIVQSAGPREAMVVVQQLRKEGLHVAVFHPVSFEDLFSVVKRLGVLTEEVHGAERLLESLRQRLDAVTRRLHAVTKRPKVFFEVRYPNLLGAGRGSIVNDIILKAGGINCIDSSKKMVRIGMEALIEYNPDVYIIQRGSMNKNPSLPSQRPNFQVIQGVKNKRVIIVDEQIYSRPGPRSVEAVEELAGFLHPDHL